MKIQESPANISPNCGKDLQRGSILIYLVVVIVVASALGAGIVSMTTTSTFTGLSYNPSDQARYLAQSGLEYARALIQSDPDAAKDSLKGGIVYTLENGEFELKYDENSDLITSIGRVFTETSREASFEISSPINDNLSPIDSKTEFDFAGMTADEIQSFINDPLVKSYQHETEDRWGAGGGDYESGVTTDDVVLKNTNPWANLFIPIDLDDTCDEYIVRSVARLETSSTNEGGYAVFFDTRLDPTKRPEPAYSFEFDRGFADGELIIRKDWQGARLKRYDDRDYLPVRSDDWWEDLHYVRLRITDNPGGSDNRRVEASVYDLDADYAYNMDDVFDFYFGPWNKRLSFNQSYNFDPGNEQIYIGLRGWHTSTYFHYLNTDMRCESPHHGDGLVLYVDDEGNVQEQEFQNIIDLSDEDDWTKLVITSGVGSQEYDDFKFIAPGGVYIESGVILSNDKNNQGVIVIESSNGDVVIEEGVDFKTDQAAGGDRDEINIQAAGNIDIRGVEINANRYIYLEAGSNIYADNANLETTSNASGTGVRFKAGNEIHVNNICIEHSKNADVEVISGDLVGSPDSSCEPVPSP